MNLQTLKFLLKLENAKIISDICSNCLNYNRLKAPVAQLDRACGYEPQGREFESLRARQGYYGNI
jgi:hypothetical protein